MAVVSTTPASIKESPGDVMDLILPKKTTFTISTYIYNIIIQLALNQIL